LSFPSCILLPTPQEMVVHGVPTTAPFHCLILENEEFKKGNVDTGFIPKHQETLTVRAAGRPGCCHAATPAVYKA